MNIIGSRKEKNRPCHFFFFCYQAFSLIDILGANTCEDELARPIISCLLGLYVFLEIVK